MKNAAVSTSLYGNPVGSDKICLKQKKEKRIDRIGRRVYIMNNCAYKPQIEKVNPFCKFKKRFKHTK